MQKYNTKLLTESKKHLNVCSEDVTVKYRMIYVNIRSELVQFCLKVTNYFNKLNGLFQYDLCEIIICFVWNIFLQSQTRFKSDVNW